MGKRGIKMNALEKLGYVKQPKMKYLNDEHYTKDGKYRILIDMKNECASMEWNDGFRWVGDYIYKPELKAILELMEE